MNMHAFFYYSKGCDPDYKAELKLKQFKLNGIVIFSIPCEFQPSKLSEMFRKHKFAHGMKCKENGSLRKELFSLPNIPLKNTLQQCFACSSDI